MSIHDPKYAYDCDNCKFNWCCGPTCHCNFRFKLKNTPLDRRKEVNKTLKSKGLKREFIIPTKNQYREGLIMTCDECEEIPTDKVLWRDRYRHMWCTECWCY